MSSIDLVGIPSGELALFKAQLAEVLNLVREPRPIPAIMCRKDAMAYSGINSDSPFDRWCKAYGVTSCSHGRYEKRKLDLGLAREAGRASK
jgi:hypothetical protein